MAKYLVSGGAGFIGSNIVKRLVENGEEVVVVDNFRTGKKDNLVDFLEQIQLFELDFSEQQGLEKAFQGVDFVLHQGAIPSVPRSIDKPVETNNSNILGTLNLLIAAQKSGVKKFVYASSSSIYGDSEILPKVETMPTKPKSFYASQKLAAENYCKNFYQIHKFPTVALRYFNVFGPQQDPNSEYSAVIPKFIKLILNDQEPVIYGDGETSRDFTYVDNNVEANILAANSGENANGQVFNIACGDRISLTDLVKEINDILGKNIEPKYTDERRGDVKHSQADISNAKELLGYQVKVDFRAGLEKTVEYYQKQANL